MNRDPGGASASLKLTVLLLATAIGHAASADAAEPPPLTAPGTTSLTNKDVAFQRSAYHYTALSANGVQAVIVDNHPLDNSLTPGHRAGYSGIASLTHEKQPRNLFVPSFAGMNFEHIHDGVTKNLKEKFEPRKAKMEMRVVDARTVELYQPATPHFQLESCGRYQMLDDGVIEYTFECIPRGRTFQRGHIGLFWASYIDSPKDKTIRFLGRRRESRDEPSWLIGRTPKHGVNSSHRPAGWKDSWAPVDADFPLTLVNHPSEWEHTHAWCYAQTSPLLKKKKKKKSSVFTDRV